MNRCSRIAFVVWNISCILNFIILNCEYNLQIHELNSQGYEVILVTSGAVGVGRQRLKYRRLVNSRYLFIFFRLYS